MLWVVCTLVHKLTARLSGSPISKAAQSSVFCIKIRAFPDCEREKEREREVRSDVNDAVCMHAHMTNTA